MKSIQDLLQNNTLSTCSGNPANQVPLSPAATMPPSPDMNTKDIAIIDRLFLKLAAIYGNTWRSLFKSHEFLEFCKQEWLEALSGFDENVLFQAVTTCREHRPYPPTIPEFIDACKKLRKKDAFFRSPKENTSPDHRVAYQHLHQIKSILNMKQQKGK